MFFAASLSFSCGYYGPAVAIVILLVGQKGSHFSTVAGFKSIEHNISKIQIKKTQGKVGISEPIQFPFLSPNCIIFWWTNIFVIFLRIVIYIYCLNKIMMVSLKLLQIQVVSKF